MIENCHPQRGRLKIFREINIFIFAGVCCQLTCVEHVSHKTRLGIEGGKKGNEGIRRDRDEGKEGCGPSMHVELLVEGRHIGTSSEILYTKCLYF